MAKGIKTKLSEYWDNFHTTFRVEGACSTCGPDYYPAMTEKQFFNLLDEIDKWIEETYGKKN